MKGKGKKETYTQFNAEFSRTKNSLVAQKVRSPPAMWETQARSRAGWGRSLEEGNGNSLWYSYLEKSMDRGAWWATIHGVTKNRTRLSDFTSYIYMEKAMATHSSTVAWKIPWTEEPGRLQSMGSRRVGHLLSSFTFTFHFYALEKETAIHSSFLAWRIPGTAEPCGLPSMWSHSWTRLK